MNTAHTFNFVGRTPDASEYANLTSLPFEKKPISETERNSFLKKGFTMIGIGAACIAGGLLFAFLLQDWAIFFIIPCFILGLLMAAAGPFIGIIGAASNFSKILAEPRKKKPETALENHIKRVLIGDDNTNYEKKNTNYAYEVLCRITPEAKNPDYKDFVLYLKEFRDEILVKVKADYKKEFKSETFPEISSGLQPVSLISNESLSPGIAKIKAKYTLTFSASRTTGGNNTTQVIYSTIELVFDVTMAQSGGFWFLYDVMPEKFPN